jgi:hypothetical protein
MRFLVATLIGLGFQFSAWSSLPGKNCDVLLSEPAEKLKKAVEEFYQASKPEIVNLSNIQTRFIPLKLKQTTSDPGFIKEQLGIVALKRMNIDLVNIDVTFSETVTALLRVDNEGLSIYYLDRNGRLEQYWDRVNQTETGSPGGFVGEDKVGPTNLIVRKLGEEGWLISYTNGPYMNSARIGDSLVRSKLIMWDTVPNATASTYIKDVFPVEVKLKSAGVKTLYWAQTDGLNGRLFTYSEKGAPVFLHKGNVLDPSIKPYIHLVGLSNLSEVVTRADLFIPSLTSEYRSHFLEKDPQIQPGGRYHYVYK